MNERIIYEKTSDQEKEDTWDFILENEIATESELQLVTDINGYNLQALNDIIEVNTGYSSKNQYIECEGAIK